jgi:hypothetical protein
VTIRTIGLADAEEDNMTPILRSGPSLDSGCTLM